MKRLIGILCAVAIIFLLCSCEYLFVPENEYRPSEVEVSKDSVSEFISLFNAEYNGNYSEDNCYNVTPTLVSNETDMQIFKFSTDCSSYVMVDGEIYPICESFGGYGFVNALPCDFDGDGNKDLYVASSSGSGIHRSVISVFNSVTKESTVLLDTMQLEDPNMDLIVSKSTANVFDKDEKGLYYSVLRVRIIVNDDNLVQLSHEMTDVVGYIEVEDNTPKFVPKSEKYSVKKTEEVLPFADYYMEFTFHSGAGAWRTSLSVLSDGTFYGLYHDSEAGAVGDDHPRGSAVVCEFEGKFVDIEKVDEHSYKMRISELITKNEVGEIWIEDDIQYIASEPHGLAGGEEFVFYLPDTPLDSVSEEFLTWWPYRGEMSKDKVIDETLSCYGILNVATDHGFFAGY